MPHIAYVKKKPTLSDAWAVASLISDSVPCGSAYLQSSIENSHDYGLLEANVLGHYLLEQEPSSALKGLTDPLWAD